MYIRIFARAYLNVQADSQIIEDVQMCICQLCACGRRGMRIYIQTHTCMSVYTHTDAYMQSVYTHTYIQQTQRDRHVDYEHA